MASGRPCISTGRGTSPRATTNHARSRLRAVETPRDQDRIRRADNQRLLDGLGWHQRRGNLLRYLEDPRIEPTNNSSERDLRGSVKARKVSHCSKNARGANATAAHLSLILTIRRRLKGSSLVNALIDLFQTGLAPPRLVTS